MMRCLAPGIMLWAYEVLALLYGAFRSSLAPRATDVYSPLKQSKQSGINAFAPCGGGLLQVHLPPEVLDGGPHHVPPAENARQLAVVVHHHQPVQPPSHLQPSALLGQLMRAAYAPRVKTRSVARRQRTDGFGSTKWKV